jgi:hypothetical protein
MDLFTFDDLEEMRNQERALFGSATGDNEASPSPQIVNNILSYSQSLGVKETKSLGIIPMHLN